MTSTTGKEKANDQHHTSSPLSEATGKEKARPPKKHLVP